MWAETAEYQPQADICVLKARTYQATDLPCDFTAKVKINSIEPINYYIFEWQAEVDNLNANKTTNKQEDVRPVDSLTEVK